MESNTLSALVTALRAPSLRVRTGLWLMRLAEIGQERNEAARQGIEAVDLRANLLARLPPDAGYTGLSSQVFLELCEAVTQQPGAGDCALVYNIDLLLARLTRQERREVWQDLYQALPHRRRVLLLAMPETATELLPEGLEMWVSARRLARIAE